MPGEITVEEWLRERLQNCERIAATKEGEERDGWIEDALYFQKALEIVKRFREIQRTYGFEKAEARKRNPLRLR